MSISIEQVRAVAKLARLHFTEDEASSMAVELSVILDYVDTLGELDTGEVEPMSHAVAGENVFREDVARQRVSKDVVLANAPDADADYFRVPKVIRQY